MRASAPPPPAPVAVAPTGLAEALRRLRGILLSHLPPSAPSLSVAPPVCERRGALPWICWLTAILAALLAWQWPHLMGSEGLGAARVTGAFVALAALAVGAAFLAWRPRLETAPVAVPLPVATTHVPHAAGHVLTDHTDPLAALPETEHLRVVQERFELSDFEARILLLCAAAELDPEVPELLRRLQGGLRQPTFAFSQRIFPDGAWDTLSENRPLLHWLMVEVRQQDGRPFSQSPLRIDDGLLQYLIGNPAPDVRIAAYHVPFPPEASSLGLSASQAAAAGALAQSVMEATKQTGVVPVITLTGPFPLAQQMTALGVVTVFGAAQSKLVRLPLTLFPTDPRDGEHLSRLWAREAILHGLSIFLETDDAAEPLVRLVVRRFFASPRTLYFLASREPVGGVPRATQMLAVVRPTAAEQHAAWEQAVGAVGLSLASPDASCLADQFHLDLPVIFGVVERAQGGEFADSPALRRHLQLAARQEHRAALDLLAQRIDAQAGLDDLVLPQREKDQLEKFIAQVELHRLVFSEWGMGGRSARGKGTAALFSGESGTGKTLAAEVIATKLGLDLYRIDLSAVVDKYIGETEKNLRRIFDAAEAGGVILFFDEADALFGKRSEVKDSHDRYANIQINYLLQRLETYRGPAILATNLGRTMDQAFLRRLRFIVRFPQPGRGERQQIWEKSFAPLADDFLPDGTKVLALSPADFHAVAAANLSGGEIRNAAIQAAFLAAASSLPITRRVVDEAISDESIKAGRPVPIHSHS